MRGCEAHLLCVGGNRVECGIRCIMGWMTSCMGRGRVECGITHCIYDMVG